MDIERLVFFNHFHNGDTFNNRAYTKDIIAKINAIEIYYAHNNHPSITQDLGAVHISTNHLPSKVNWGMGVGHDEANKTLYVNTWVGVTLPRYFLPGQHANFVIFSKVWHDFYDQMKLTLNGDYNHYLPSFDYSCYDLQAADKFLHAIGSTPLILICNGPAHSGQSQCGDMRYALIHLSNEFKDHVFLTCHPLDVKADNIVYTNDLFQGQLGNLPHIAYLSEHAKIIVGKNSGPFTFAHTEKNLNNCDKTFLCFSTEEVSCLTGQGEYYATTLFSPDVDDQKIYEIIARTIKDHVQSTDKKPIRTVR